MLEPSQRTETLTSPVFDGESKIQPQKLIDKKVTEQQVKIGGEQSVHAEPKLTHKVETLKNQGTPKKSSSTFKAVVNAVCNFFKTLLLSNKAPNQKVNPPTNRPQATDRERLDAFNNLCAELNISPRKTKTTAPVTRSLNNEEQRVKDIFKKKMSDPTHENAFNEMGYMKLSRKETKLDLKNSYYIQKVGDTKDSSHRIFKVVHGKEGFIGKGAMKIAKLWVPLDSEKSLVRAHFKDRTPDQIKEKFGEMKTILERLKKNPVANTSPGHYIEVRSNKTTNKVNACIVTEYAETDLEKLIKKGELTRPQKMQLMEDIVGGVAGLHKEGIYHRDIKPANINIQKGCAYIADFDLAVQTAKAGSREGTRRFMAPEVLLGKVANDHDLEMGDSYAVGVTLYKLQYGIYPWMDGINRASHDTDWEKKYGDPDINTIGGLIYQLMHPDPSARISVRKAQEALSKMG